MDQVQPGVRSFLVDQVQLGVKTKTHIVGPERTVDDVTEFETS